MCIQTHTYIYVLYMYTHIYTHVVLIYVRLFVCVYVYECMYRYVYLSLTDLKSLDSGDQKFCIFYQVSQMVLMYKYLRRIGLGHADLL